MSAPEPPYLASTVGPYVAVAVAAAALLLFLWPDWVRLVSGLLTSVRHRRIATPDERLAWLIILATIPVGATGLLLEPPFRTTLAVRYPVPLVQTRTLTPFAVYCLVAGGAGPAIVAGR